MKPFQFLIGTIKTMYALAKGDAELWFQFLIGTIKTQSDSTIMPSKLQFQFLIGTIKTFQVLGVSNVIYVVSIPYRYYKNMGSRNFLEVLIEVSIPYRYYKNINELASVGSDMFGFNSL